MNVEAAEHTNTAVAPGHVHSGDSLKDFLQNPL